MRSSPVLLIILLLLWVSASVLWYSCRFQGNCLFSKSDEVVQTLLIDLEGQDQRTVLIRQGNNGVLEFLPGADGQGLNGIRQYLSDHPGRDLNIVTANEAQANGLMAMLILSGIPNDRLNMFTDPSLGSKGRPLTITSSPGDYPPDTIEPASVDTIVAVETMEVPEVADPDETAVPSAAVIPCPALNLEGERPQIEDLHYGSASYSIRCTDRLKRFANAAQPLMTAQSGNILVITGHTDDNQNKTNNYQLALKRAVEVKKYFIRLGLPGDLIETYSRGGDDPIGDNNTPEGQLANRRVTISWK